MKPIRLAIVGSTGLVGRTILKVLEEEKLPLKNLTLFASSKSAGKEISFMGQNYIVQELTPNSFLQKFDYAIFSAGSETAKKYGPIATSNGCIVIDNSSAFRMDANVPLVVPEVNPNTAFSHNGIIANPNCSTIQAVVSLKPLDDAFSIKRIVYSTYQAVSGAGYNGILDLKNGIKNLNCKLDISEIIDTMPSISYNLNKFPYPIFNNCIPHIDTFLDNGYTKEEEKMINETRKILNKPNLNITATTVRVPVFNCHSESINVEFEKDFNLDAAKNLLKSFNGIVLQDDNNILNYPISQKVSNHNEVFVGRVRRDFSVASGLNLWVVADNLRKGAATNAVQILKLLLK